MRMNDLRKLARRHGLMPSYRDIFGRTVRAGREALLAVLAALGVEPETPGDDASWQQEPVVVAWDGEGARIPVGVADGRRVRALIEPEEGEPFGLDLVVSDGAVTISGRVEAGFHRVRLEGGGEPGETLLISAPRHSYVPEDEGRRRALFLPLHALRCGRSPATGDYTALGDLAEWAGEVSGAQVGTLPLFAAHLDSPLEPSPYAPASRLFLSELYVDPAAAPELAGSAEARRMLEGGGPAAGEHVDFRAVMAFRRGVIEALLASLPAGSDRRAAFEAFVAARPVLGDYASFRAAGERRGAAWPDWEEAARSGRLAPGDYDPDARRYHEYVQFLAAEQLAAASARARDAGSGLQLDLPVGAATASYEVWRRRGLFALGASVGAPPDDFFLEGQDWGFPPLAPSEMRRDGYRYLRECLALVMESADVLRVDHVMGIQRLYLVPRGFPATEGVYLRYPAEEIAAVLSLLSHRHRCRVVGENLGTVPTEVNRLLARHDFAGMSVVQFTTRPDRADAVPRPEPGESICVNTHDMEPFAAFLAAAREDGRAAALASFLGREGYPVADQTDPVTVHGALAEWLGASEAGQVVLSLEDFFGETRHQNRPGTVTEPPNFSRTAARTLEEMRDDEDLARALAAFAAARDGERRPAEMTTNVVNATRLTDEDLFFFGEGTHLELGDRLGAHPGEHGGEAGYWFSVWAPNAERVTVLGDFNGWDPDSHELYPRGGSGIWEGFVPGVEKGCLYKYRIFSKLDGYRVDKADPFGIRQETPPKTGSVAWDLDYEWDDAEWMAARAEPNAASSPISVYEVHLGSFIRVPEEGDRPLTYREIAPRLADYVSGLGFTHVELMPVMEHPFYGSWGYQLTGLFAPTSRYGTPQDFMALVDHLHRRGIGVILDWVPSHFPKDEHGLGYFDGSHLFEHSDPRKGEHPDWGGYIYNYGRHEVRAFLLSAGMHWLRRYHADGLRTDAVASMLYLDYSRKAGEWIPNEYGGRENLDAIHLLRKLNEEVYRVHPDVMTVAEESTAWPGVSRPTYAGGLGFGMKWDMGWMHDTLRYFGNDPIHRKWHHHELTFRAVYAFTENFMLPLSHDEVVHGKRSLLEKMPGDDWQKFANLRLLYAYMWASPGKKLLFMGGEFAQRREWAHDRSLDWDLLKVPAHSGVQALVRDLNRLYRETPALHARDFDPAGFEWVEGNDAEQSVYAFLRRGEAKGDLVLVVVNATPVVRTNYRLGVPAGGEWKEILNTDAKVYGGSGQGNLGGVQAKPLALHGRSHSVTLTLPPLGALFLAPA